MTSKNYNCKVLLYGEYTVLYGSPAFAIPSNIFSGKWEKGHRPHFDLERFCNYLTNDDRLSQILDVDQMDIDIQNGWFFESNIPVGYGLGSSGALTAAVYDRYAKDASDEVVELQDIFSHMEAHFHGRSSGIDPLVSFLNCPVLKNDDGLHALEDNIGKGGHRIFLLDSGMSRSTSQLVDKFKSRLEDEGVHEVVERDWAPLVQNCIDAHIEGDQKELLSNIKRIQNIIWEVFPEFIPEPHMDFWSETLDDQTTSLKLCGAGGGGMTLGFGEWPKTDNPLWL